MPVDIDADCHCGLPVVSDLIALACHPRISEPVETRREIFDHAACLPSPWPENGWQHPQSAVGSTFMLEPCVVFPIESYATQLLQPLNEDRPAASGRSRPSTCR